MSGQRWALVVEAAGSWSVPPDRRLARALKALLRSYGLRCVSVEPVPEIVSPEAER